MHVMAIRISTQRVWHTQIKGCNYDVTGATIASAPRFSTAASFHLPERCHISGVLYFLGDHTLGAKLDACLVWKRVKSADCPKADVVFLFGKLDYY